MPRSGGGEHGCELLARSRRRADVNIAESDEVDDGGIFGPGLARLLKARKCAGPVLFRHLSLGALVEERREIADGRFIFLSKHSGRFP